MKPLEANQISYVAKILVLVLLLFAMLSVLLSWGRYTLGSIYFNKMVHAKSAPPLIRLTWVHPARKITIEDAEMLNYFADTVKNNSELGVQEVKFNDTGSLVFEFDNGSYFTLRWEEKWSSQENALICCGYNVW